MDEIRLDYIHFITKGNTAKLICKLFCSNRRIAKNIGVICFSADINRNDYWYRCVLFDNDKSNNRFGKLFRDEFCRLYDTTEDFSAFISNVIDNLKNFIHSRDDIVKNSDIEGDKFHTIVPYRVGTSYGEVVDDVRGTLL